MTQSQFTTDGADSVSERVIEAVAAETGTDPLDLNPLYEAINPDCLDALFKTTGGGLPRNIGTVSFRYYGCNVTVSSSGEVEATSPNVATATEPEAQTGN